MRICLLVAAFTCSSTFVLGQQMAQRQKEHVIGATTQEVMLDVVVRDKKGRMVKNLRADEIEVTDDGVVRKLRSFRTAGGGGDSDAGDLDVSATSAKTPAERAINRALNPAREPRLITLVFDQLLPGQRPYAKQAALELLKASGQHQLFAVFKIDTRLSLIESYTGDAERVRTAIERATDPSYFLNIDEEDRIGKSQSTAALAEQLTAMKAASAGAGAVASTEQRITQMTLNMLQFADTGAQKEQSRAQLLGLWAVVKEQKQLPGRKTVVYFTGGMNVPPEYNERFRSIVADANLANVSVYAINAGGIASYKSNDSGTALLAQASASSRSNMMDRTGIISVDQAQVFDRAEDSIHANIHNSLEVLTRDTGGFYASNTNDFRAPLRRIAEEVNFHYELTYSPEIEKYDGHLRKVVVKVARPDVRVQTRSGYYAMPAIEGQDLQPYEGPMLSALSMGSKTALPFRAEAKWFGSKTALVVDVPIEQVALVADEAAGSFRMHMSVLGLFKDSTGSIIQKVTRDVPAQGKFEHLQATRSGHFIFTQHVELPPGRYTLETAVFDRESLKIGTKKQMVIVPAPRPDGLSLSSLSLVRKVGPVESADRENPYEFVRTKVTPELNSTIKGGPGSSLGIYLVVFGQTEQPATLTIDFLQDGKLVARSEPPMPDAAMDGRVPVLAQLPIHTLKPGVYEIHAKVFQGGRGTEERLLIEIE